MSTAAEHIRRTAIRHCDNLLALALNATDADDLGMWYSLAVDHAELMANTLEMMGESYL